MLAYQEIFLKALKIILNQHGFHNILFGYYDAIYMKKRYMVFLANSDYHKIVKFLVVFVFFIMVGFKCLI